MDVYNQLHEELASCTKISDTVRDELVKLKINSERQNTYSKPMLWIGIYIGVASLFCILPIVADLLHGLKTKKLWFPCKYFTLNAASLTVIAVTMKLPMDLNNPMPGGVDQVAKLGSMAFMCIIMANQLPSLATMDSKVLLTNIIALVILVITVVVNVCIQIETGVVSGGYNILAIIYVAMLLELLMIYTCSALMILKSKQVLELKYQEGHETASKDLELQHPGRITVEKLKQHVSKHWIMAGTGSPQFMSVCSVTTSASGVICVASTAILCLKMFFSVRSITFVYASDYKWSVVVILITQFIGIILGIIAPLSRLFASLSFEVSIKWILNHINVFKVESYFTQKLYDWKLNDVPFQFSSRRSRIAIHNLKVQILNFLIVFQMTVVVVCKITTLITNFFVTGVWCCLYCWKWFHVKFGAASSVSIRNPAQLQQGDFSQYVLQLQDDMELAERTLTSISKSVTRLVQAAGKQQPNNLMKLLQISSGFEGVGKYDMHCVPLSSKENYVDCWSLPIVTLTTIAISLPNIQNNKVERLLKSVCEGLKYIKHVEETLNATDEYVIGQKAARTLWLEVEVYQKWLGNRLHAHQVKTTKEIVQWFCDKAKRMITELESKNMKGSDDTSLYKSVSASSMHRITHTILASDHANIDVVSQEELFEQLATMISNILAACLTNLPQVIAMKCHTNVIEKREESVHAAAQLLGETMQIINSLQDRQLPSLDRDELPFIYKWRDCFLQNSP